MSSAAGSNSTKMNESTNTIQAAASASPIKTFSANEDISSDFCNSKTH